MKFGKWAQKNCVLISSCETLHQVENTYYEHILLLLGNNTSFCHHFSLYSCSLNNTLVCTKTENITYAM